MLLIIDQGFLFWRIVILSSEEREDGGQRKKSRRRLEETAILTSPVFAIFGSEADARFL
jgi:hypothetical protein